MKLVPALASIFVLLSLVAAPAADVGYICRIKKTGDVGHHARRVCLPHRIHRLDCGGLNYACASDGDCCDLLVCYIPPGNTYGECTDPDAFLKR